jgi:hypothetical protein
MYPLYLGIDLHLKRIAVRLEAGTFNGVETTRGYIKRSASAELCTYATKWYNHLA